MKWPEKKTEKLELRLPKQTKQAFLARCRSEDRSASEVLRSFIDEYLARPISQKDFKMIVRSPFTYVASLLPSPSAALSCSPRPQRSPNRISRRSSNQWIMMETGA